MALGERIRLARRIRSMSLRDLATHVAVTPQAISKYERGLNAPSSGVLLQLAKALEVNVEFFFRPVQVRLSPATYRKRASLPVRDREAILSKVQEWLERYLEVESLVLPEPEPFVSPTSAHAHPLQSVEEAERVAESLRRAWDLGLDPIENLTELLEDKGIKVGLVSSHNAFDACTFYANSVPVIVVNRDLPGDRQRFNLAHELAHLVLSLADQVDAERAAHRFAGALLVGTTAAIRELGTHRHDLHVEELHILKHKYRLSMQGWIYRAKDLGILPESAATALFRRFRKRGWHIREPGEPLPPEEPKRFDRLVAQALAEDLISEPRAAELLGRPLMHLWLEHATR